MRYAVRQRSLSSRTFRLCRGFLVLLRCKSVHLHRAFQANACRNDAGGIVNAGLLLGDEPYKRPMAMSLSAVVTATLFDAAATHRLCWRQLRKCRTMRVSYRTGTSRIPRRMPLPDGSGAAQDIRRRPHPVSDSPSIFDAPRTFPESPMGRATIRTHLRQAISAGPESRSAAFYRDMRQTRPELGLACYTGNS